jgi:hypothetical protein
LEICDQAHREVTGQPLCPDQPDARAEEVRRHIDQATCPDCLRWFRNALRAYQKLAAPAPRRPVLAVRSVPAPLARPHLGPRERPAKNVTLAAGGEPNKHVVQEVEPVPGGAGLDALALSLDWHRSSESPAPDGPRWWLALKFTAKDADPNHERQLRELDGHLLTFTLRAFAGAETTSVEARLGLDQDGRLVSTPKPLPIGPREQALVGLQLRDKVGGLDDR